MVRWGGGCLWAFVLSVSCRVLSGLVLEKVRCEEVVVWYIRSVARGERGIIHEYIIYTYKYVVNATHIQIIPVPCPHSTHSTHKITNLNRQDTQDTERWASRAEWRQVE